MNVNYDAWEMVECDGEPTARHENSFVTCGNEIFLMGGRGVKPVNAFNPTTRNWRILGPTPLQIHHFQPVVLGDVVYAVGAMTGSFPTEPPLENIYLYYPKTDTWKVGPEIPADRRRGSSGVAVRDGKIYVVGGIKVGHSEGCVAWFDEFDPATGVWQTLPDAPRVRDHFPAVIAGDKLYAIGGRNSADHSGKVGLFSSTIGEVDVYSFKTGTWETLKDTLPFPRAAGSAAPIGDAIIYAGGESGELDTAHGDVHILDTATGTWHEGPRLVRGRHGSQGAIFNNALYIAAGSGNRGGSPELSSVERLSFSV